MFGCLGLGGIRHCGRRRLLREFLKLRVYSLVYALHGHRTVQKTAMSRRLGTDFDVPVGCSPKA